MDQGVLALVAELERQAREEAEAILSRARAAAGFVLEEARDRAEAERKRLSSETERQIEHIKNQARSAAQLAATKRLQTRREEIILRAFEHARSAFAEMPAGAERQASLVGLVEEAARALGGGSLTVTVNRVDRAALTSDRLREISQSLTREGVTCELSPAQETVDIMGGAIVATRDRRQRFDNSWESRMQRQMPLLRPRVWEILAGQADARQDETGVS